MIGKLLARKRQILANPESTEGTYVDPVAGDAGFIVYEPKYVPDVAFQERKPAGLSISHRSGIPGRSMARFTFGVDMNGSGVVATPPKWDALLRACGFQQVAPVKLTIGAIAGGPFESGEVVDQASSGAQGQIIKETVNGETTLWVRNLTTTAFDGTNGLTGATSGATATPSAVDTTSGVLYFPDSDVEANPSLSLAGRFSLSTGASSGIKVAAAGCRGNVTFVFTAGEGPRMNFEFSGVVVASADAGLLTGVTEDPTRPPVFLSTALSWPGDVNIPFDSVQLNMANTVTMRRDANAAFGYLSALVTDRDPAITTDPELTKKTDFDFYGKLFAGTEGRFQFDVGLVENVAGNRFLVSAPKTQLRELGDDERESLSVAGAQMRLVGTRADGDDELFILQY